MLTIICFLQHSYMLTYIVHLLDKYNKIYNVNSIYCIRIMSYLVMGVRCSVKSK